ncbi:hypothetical protein COCON_G00024590 [Conger conger]|uniref:Scaffolding anchor of CK1 domain-containing protein n=1 Tax=Conger conger TaxID=82655 RepID=A0A9Q1DXI2_CONCO|nr:hypothetical protein COCON_G00024590 [Conger conger]
MADSQLMCMDDGHINEKIMESNPEFYYSEEQRAALEQLLINGDGAFKDRLKEDKVNDFLSAREIKSIRHTFQEHCTDSEDNLDSAPAPAQTVKRDSGIHSTYWPQMSDVEVPPLDIGWPDGSSYKGVTRVMVHTNPPKENCPRIKQVVRKMIQESNKVVAVVMDLLTDLQILQDLLDAACKRSVSVYILLDRGGEPHFLDMCSRLQVSARHLRNIRVRTVQGGGLLLAPGKLPGSLCNRYMLVDGDKVMFGSYSFTWSSSRIDRSTMLLMTGHVVDTFDRDFRELYAVSEEVDLYGELHIEKELAPMPAPVRPKVEHQAPPPTSRFMLQLGDPRDIRTKIPAHKYYNPKYSLVVGSLQDISSAESPTEPETQSNTILKANSERPDRPSPQPDLPADSEGKGSLRRPKGLALLVKKPSIRSLLRVKTADLNGGGGDVSSPSPTRASRRSIKFFPPRLTIGGPVDKEPGDKSGDKEASPQIKGRLGSLSRGSKNSSLQKVNSQEGEAPKAQEQSEKGPCIIS